MSGGSAPVLGPADLVLREVAFARVSDGRISARGTAEELIYRRSTAHLVGSDAAVRFPPSQKAELASLGSVYLAAPRVEAEVAAHRGTASGGVRLDSEHGDRGRTERAAYDGSRDLLTGDAPVDLRGPGYAVRSRGFVARADGSAIQLLGGVAGRLEGSQP
jgi:hypothetical protein